MPNSSTPAHPSKTATAPADECTNNRLELIDKLIEIAESIQNSDVAASDETMFCLSAILFSGLEKVQSALEAGSTDAAIQSFAYECYHLSDALQRICGDNQPEGLTDIRQALEIDFMALKQQAFSNREGDVLVMVSPDARQPAIAIRAVIESCYRPEGFDKLLWNTQYALLIAEIDGVETNLYDLSTGEVAK